MVEFSVARWLGSCTIRLAVGDALPKMGVATHTVGIRGTECVSLVSAISTRAYTASSNGWTQSPKTFWKRYYPGQSTIFTRTSLALLITISHHNSCEFPLCVDNISPRLCVNQSDLSLGIQMG